MLPTALPGPGLSLMFWRQPFVALLRKNWVYIEPVGTLAELAAERSAEIIERATNSVANHADETAWTREPRGMWGARLGQTRAGTIGLLVGAAVGVVGIIDRLVSSL